jgi:hypothetical protein
LAEFGDPGKVAFVNRQQRYSQSRRARPDAGENRDITFASKMIMQGATWTRR